MRVVIADDNLLMREGIAALVRRAGIEVVAEADDGDALVHAVEEHAPDAVIVDVRMPPTHTVEGLRAAHVIREGNPRIGIVILSQTVEAGTALQILAERPQGLGYLLKDRVTDIQEFAGTLRRVAAGGSALDPKVVTELLASPPDPGPLGRLTPREREVLALVAEGRSNKGAGERLERHRARGAQARDGDLREARARGGRGRQSPHPGRPRVPASGRIPHAQRGA